MTDIRHVQHGDLVILSTGEEAIANGIVDYYDEKQIYKIEYKKPVLGWPDEEKQFSWWYEKDGTFAKSDTDRRACVDIMKVVQHGHIQTED